MSDKPAWQVRFWRKVEKGKDPEACWIWRGWTNSDGYGFYKPTQDHNTTAHRMSYEIAFGEVGAGFDVHHKCEVRNCVNPNHLEKIIEAIHVRMGNSPANINRNKTICIHGHELAGSNLRVMRDGRRKCITCERARCRRNSTTRVRRSA